MIDITILGTSSMVPTKDRNHSSAYFDLGKYAVMVDCGEGTQRQLKIAKLRPNKINKIFISHWHGDHVLGLPGLIQTMAATNYTGELEIYGPATTKQRIKSMFDTFIFDKEIKLDVKEIEKDGLFLRTKDHSFYAYHLEHGIPTLGFVIEENDKRKMDSRKLKKFGITGKDAGILQEGKSVTVKGRKIQPDDVSKTEKGNKIGIISDTTFCNNLVNVAKDADLLICEATYLDELEEKALEYKHFTARQAAGIASQANAKKLILTHFSARYDDVDALVKEAQEIFPDTKAAYDIMRIKLR